MVVPEGSKVSLHCEATGSPAPNITWRREDGQDITLSNGQKGQFNPYQSLCSRYFEIIEIHLSQ